MIFVILGSQKFQFNRLLMSVDHLIEKKIITESVFAQKGYSDYLPRFFQYTDFMDQDQFNEMQNRADLIITHGGTGSIISAVRKDKKVIAVPRRAKYGEHVDDHQVELIEMFAESNLIKGCYDLDDLSEAIKEAEKMTPGHYEQGTYRYIELIGKFIDNMG